MCKLELEKNVENLLNLFHLFYLGCTKSLTCEPGFGIDYSSCTMETFHNVKSWERCSVICFLIPACKAWTWAHQASTFSPLTCWLKTGTCTMKNSSNFISGTAKCGDISKAFDNCAPNYGLEYPGCDLKWIKNIKTWEKCSQLCHSTDGCKFWTWINQRHNKYSHSCWLKRSLCDRKSSAFGISGGASTYSRCNSVSEQSGLSKGNY